MDSHRLENVSAAISFIETHLDETLSLDTIARAAGYSKFHLHRMFTQTVGITPHAYIRRRQLTEAAKRLAFSEKPVLEIALTAGYESQQAFTSVFKAMYKRTPAQYRQERFFYPLQGEFKPNQNTGVFVRETAYATFADVPGWMDFAALVVDGFPCLDEASHREQIRRYIRKRQALIVQDGAVIIGAAAFSAPAGSIDFLAVHPQYRQDGVAEALLGFVRRLFAGREISITTFREGDKADTGQRKAYKRLGFAEAELLTEFGYPTQRFVLPPKQKQGGTAGRAASNG